LFLTLGIAAMLVAAELALRARCRSRVLPPPAAIIPGKVTVVALGDSITAGPAGAPDAAWPAIVEARLRAGYPDTSWQVINAGVPGDTAPLGYARFDRDVAARGPQIVLIAFGLNDCHLARHAMDRWYERRVPSGPASSYLWRAAQARIERLATRLGLLSDPAPELMPQPFPRTTPDGFSAALDALIARSQEIGAHPVLLTMTPLADERAPDVQGFRAGYAPNNARIRELAGQRGLPLVDLASGAPDDAFEPDGFHLTIAGQRWAGDRIYETLATAGVWAALAEGER
jgi:lysophospholipase L1-like esterase